MQSMPLGGIQKVPLDTRVPDPCTHKGINGSRVRPHILQSTPIPLAAREKEMFYGNIKL